MSTLYVAEFFSIGGTGNFPVSGALQPPIHEQTVTIGGTSTQSTAFNANTSLIRVHTDSICSIEVGTNPTATTSTARMAANQTEYFSIPPGSSYKIAVITNT